MLISRCAILTFFVLEPDGHWRIVALPMKCPDHPIHLGSGSQVKMDGLHLVSPSVVSPVSVDQQSSRMGDTTEISCSFKPFAARGFSGPTFHYQSQNKGWADKGKRLNALPANSSCHTSVNSNDSSVMSPVGSSATNSSDSLIDIPQVDKAVKRNSKKKRKKKGKGNKKLSCNTAATDQEGISGSSTYKTAICKNTVYGIEQRATKLAVSSPELCGNENDSEGNSSGTVNHSETPKAYTSYVDEVDVLEANFLDEHPLSSSKNGFQMLERGLQDTHSKPDSCFNNSCPCVSSEGNDSSMLDSFSVCSCSDESINAVSPVQSSKKDTGETDLLEPPGYIAKNVCCSHGNLSNGVADSYFHAEGTTTRGQICATGDITMRGKQSKKDPRNSSYSCLSSIGKFYGRSGKENNHSVWQKVQRNDNDECKCGLRKVSSSDSQSGIGLKEVPLLKKSSNVAQSDALSICKDNSQSKLKASKKLKRITTPASKQELKYYSGKGSYSTNVPVNNIQQNEVLAMKVKLGGLKGLNGDSRYFSKIRYPRIGFQTNRVRSITSEPIHSLEGCYNELKLVENVCATLSSINDQTAKSDSSLLSGFSDHQEQTVLLRGQSTGLRHSHGGEEVNKIDKDFSPVEHRKQDYSSGSILQKWIPTGIVHSEIAKSYSSGLQSDNLNKPAVGSCNQVNTAREMATDPDAFAPSVNTGVMCTVQHSRDDNGLHSEYEVEIEKHWNQSTCTLKESCVKHACTECSRVDPKDQSISSIENDSNKIAQAVNDAHTVKLASEAVQMATGCPIAEFERLLHSASPVVCLPQNILHCETCLRDEFVNVPLCRHEMPSISLGSLWQWYEKHGTYGLEVRAEDYENSKRLGIDRFAFRAYFVPFLSAVQLFRNRKKRPSNSSKRISGTEPMQACNMGERSENSTDIGGLPIFSILVPQPHMADTSTLSPRNCVCCSETSSVCVEGNATIQPDDSELLFEYFEVEQPQQRQSLFEMIKELVRGDGPSQYRAYGDPTKLDSVSLDDLHPASWYSVAWYPIYRIPDGNFRAAFLTYHSLGHLVNTSAISDSGAGACLVSPVVGLQSYNAQGECWFRPRQSALNRTTETLSLNPLRVLKERLRTLEQTASCMARAVVTKGNLTCVNRQPDYEFFLSRQGR